MRASFVVGFLLCAVPAWAQQSIVGGTRARITDRVVVGGSTFGEVMRIVGSPTVSSGTGTMNPAAVDADGDVLEDSNTTVSTAGAWTWGGAGSFASTLNVDGFITSNSGTILRLGHQTRVETAAPVFVWKETDQGTDGKNWRTYSENGIFRFELLSDAESSSGNIFTLARTGLVPGDWRWGSLLSMVRPENNGGTNLGSLTKKYLTLHAWELWVDTLVARETIATIGGRIFVAPTTKLKLDLGSGDTCLSVEHNNLRTNDTVLLQKNGKFEKILIGTNAIDCSVSGNCAQVFAGYNYCSLTRNRDGTGANDWSAGDAVLNEGNTGDGYIDLYADRSATSEGYHGQIVTDGPIAYWRMNETTSTTTADVMGNVGVATETGTQSNGLGVNSTLLGTTASDPVWQNTNAGGYLLVADDTDLRITGDLTLELWVYWEAGGGADNILSRGALGEYHLQVNADGSLTFCQGNASTFECEATAASFLPASTYTHIAVVRDATSSPKRVLFYKNGAFVSSSTYTQAVTAQALSTAIGENPASLGSPFDGNIDEPAIYNYQVSADRLLLHYNARLNDSISKFTVGPTLCGNVRTGTGAFDLSERWCLGNLAGTYGYASSPTAVYGFASGNASATWISADATNGFRIMNGSTEKLKADTSGNLSLTGDLTIGTSGSLRSGATAYDTTTGYWLDYNSGTPRFRIGTTSAGTSYLRWTGSALEMKSNTLTVDSTGIEMATNTAAAYATNYGYRFSSGLGNSVFGVHAFETAGGRTLGVINTSDTPGKPVSAVLFAGASSGNASVDVTNNNAGTRGVTMNAIATMSLLNQSLSITNLTSLQINGLTGLSTTVVVPCGTLTFTHGSLTSKGAC